MTNIQRSAIERFMTNFEKKEIKMGEVIIRQGEPINNIYIIKSGEFEVEIQKQKDINGFFDINYYMNFSEIFRFTNERNCELKGVYHAIDNHKVRIKY